MSSAIPISLQVGQGRSKQLTGEQLINMYIEQSPLNARSQAYATSSPGWSSFVNLQSFAERDFSDSAIASVRQIEPSPDVSSGQLSGITFKPDGTKMYTHEVNSIIIEYSLSTAWDINTASQTDTYTVESDVHKVTFKPDGKRFWGVATTPFPDGRVRSYTLGTAWDLTTASTDNLGYTVTADGVYDVQFKPDGTQMYLVQKGNTSGNSVHQYTLSTAWDVTTATADSKTLSLWHTTSTDGNIWFTPEGLHLYEVSDFNSQFKLYRYTLAVPWDLSTAGAAEAMGDLTSNGVAAYYGLYIAPDDPHFYVADMFGFIEQYSYTLTSSATDSRKKFIRGFHVTPADGKYYAVVGTTLYYIESDGTKNQLGTIGGSGRVSMADNGTQMVITSQGRSYVYTVADGLSAITDLDFPNADTVTFIDGYFVFNNNETGGQWFISALNDGTNYDALDFATAERLPDNLLKVFADHNELLLFGAESIEIWFNSGNADFPFSRAQGSVIERGLGSRWTVEKVADSVMFLDNSGVVRVLNGPQVARVSTHAIEHAISEGDWTNASAWSYEEEGHEFYLLYVPKPRNSGKAGTYVYDATTGLWSQRKSYEKEYLNLGFYAYAYNKHLVGSLDSGEIFEMSLDTYDEAGDPLISEMQMPQVRNAGDRFKVRKLELDMEVGLGATETVAQYYTYPDSPVWTSYSGESTRTAMAYGDDQFVAVGGGSSARSTNCGEDWTYITTGISSENDVYYGDQWVAVGDTGQYATSTNGVSWVQTSTGTDDLQAVFYGDSLWMIAGANGSLKTSTDTSTWTARTTGFGTSTINDVHYGSSLWVAVAAAGKLETSLDGITWVTRTSSFSTTNINAVAYGNGVWVAVGDTGKLATSTNGFDWTQSATTLDEDNLNDVVYIDDLWVAVGDGGIWTSDDGSTWTSRSADTNVDADIAAAALGSGCLVITSATEYTDQLPLTQSASTAVVEPQVMLDVSGNVRTFDMTQKWASSGLIGEYDKRVVWRRLGQHRSFTPRIRVSAPCRRSIYAAYVKITG